MSMSKDGAGSDRVVLEIKTSRTGEETPEAMVQFLASLTNLRVRKFLLFRLGIPLSLEIGVVDQFIHFYVTIPAKYQSFIESQLVSQYPKALVVRVKDYLPDMVVPDSTLE